MNSSSSNPPPTPPGEASGKKVRKPYTITKSRESWTDEEHDKFLEALQLFDRDWKKIEDFVASKTVIQIRSHAQKYFLKVQKNGTGAHVPPPRPKRKAAHPYPQKAPKNVLIPLHASMAYPSSPVSLATRYPMWDDASMLVNSPLGGSMQLENECNSLIFEGDNGQMGAVNCNTSDFISSPAGVAQGTELSKQCNQDSAPHGIPDFAEVYSFIGSVFDPEGTDHMHKLKEMDPINFETVLLLMRNLTVNLSDPDFEPIRNVLSSYDTGTKTINVSAGTIIDAE